MIELTEDQTDAMALDEAAPTRAVDPRTRATYVLLPLAEFEKLVADYDDSGWTREELHAQAWQAGRSIGWEAMDEYDAETEGGK